MIEEVSGRMFRENKQLQELSLAHNEIQTLPGEHRFRYPRHSSIYSESLFHTNKNLVHLDLSYNKINHIPKVLFTKTKKLKTLLIGKNKIKVLDKGTFLNPLLNHVANLFQKYLKIVLN